MLITNWISKKFFGVPGGEDVLTEPHLLESGKQMSRSSLKMSAKGFSVSLTTNMTSIDLSQRTWWSEIRGEPHFLGSADKVRNKSLIKH